MDPRVKEFLEACRDWHLWSMRAMIGKPSALGGDREAVCYSGCLGDCESAENAIIPRLQMKNKREDKHVFFCYVFPLNPNAATVYDVVEKK